MVRKHTKTQRKTKSRKSRKVTRRHRGGSPASDRVMSFVTGQGVMASTPGTPKIAGDVSALKLYQLTGGKRSKRGGKRSKRGGADQPRNSWARNEKIRQLKLEVAQELRDRQNRLNPQRMQERANEEAEYFRRQGNNYLLNSENSNLNNNDYPKPRDPNQSEGDRRIEEEQIKNRKALSKAIKESKKRDEERLKVLFKGQKAGGATDFRDTLYSRKYDGGRTDEAPFFNAFTSEEYISPQDLINEPNMVANPPFLR
jgi:hypothetical protein